MALVKCLECGAEISDKAIVCPSCGFPLNNVEEKGYRDSNIISFENDSSHFKKRKNIHIYLIAVLMIIFGIDDISKVFVYFSSWLENIINLYIFDFYTMAYFVLVVKSATKVLGFVLTGLILLSNRKKECLSLTMILIGVSYSLNVVEHLFYLLVWLDFESIVNLLLSGAELIIWFILLLKPINNENNKSKNLLSFIAVILLILTFISTINGSFYFGNIDLLMLIFEYLVFILLVRYYSDEIDYDKNIDLLTNLYAKVRKISFVKNTAKRNNIYCLNSNIDNIPYDNYNDKKICPECGNELNNVTVCPNCGYYETKNIKYNKIDKKTKLKILGFTVMLIVAILLISTEEFKYYIKNISYYTEQYENAKSHSSGFLGGSYVSLANKWKQLRTEAYIYIASHSIGAVILSLIAGKGLYRCLKK